MYTMTCPSCKLTQPVPQDCSRYICSCGQAILDRHGEAVYSFLHQMYVHCDNCGMRAENVVLFRGGLPLPSWKGPDSFVRGTCPSCKKFGRQYLDHIVGGVLDQPSLHAYTDADIRNADRGSAPC